MEDPLVSIFHFGDSHIQGDGFSGIMRTELQKKYGTAGRGLIFPYCLAKTNHPSDVSSKTNIIWQFKSNLKYSKELPTGLAGYCAKPINSHFSVEVKTKSQNGIDNGFNKIQIIQSNHSSQSTLVAKFSESDSFGLLPSTENDFGLWKRTIFEFEEPVNQINFQEIPSSIELINPTIYGIILENTESSGILYHTAGVNGAQLFHFQKSDFFIDQAAALNPKLIIVSLGTNEVFNDFLDTMAWGKKIDTLILRFREKLPGVCFLFTTPPDSWRNGTPRPLLESISKILYQKAEELDFAVWDFREVMGGKGSMKTWNRARLSQDDLVHLTQTGYNLQGFLLIEALEKAQKEMYGH